MKFLSAVILLVITIVCVSSCKKDSAPQDTSFINGTWELRGAECFCPAKTYPPRNGNIWKFSDSEYEKYVNGNLVKSGQYTISTDNSAAITTGHTVSPGQFSHRIILDNDVAAEKIFIEVSNNTLMLLSGFFPSDGGSLLTYEKQ